MQVAQSTARLRLWAELACDADFEYFTKWGSVANVENRINSIINSNNVLYEAQTGLSHTITTIIVRTSSNQPYTQKEASNLLSQFRNHWNANHGNIQRDVAHLFTGKTLAGNTIGIAYLGVVCNIPWAYGLSRSDFSTNFACVTDLTAHELGHNWNAPHCSCPNHTMNAYITCANDFHSSSISATLPCSGRLQYSKTSTPALVSCPCSSAAACLTIFMSGWPCRISRTRQPRCTARRISFSSR